MADTRNMQLLKSIALVAFAIANTTVLIDFFFFSDEPRLWFRITVAILFMMSGLPELVMWATKGEK